MRFNWFALASEALSKMPVERWLLKPRDTTKTRDELKQIIEELPTGKAPAKQSVPSTSEEEATQEEALQPRRQSKVHLQHMAPAGPTTEETVAYQNMEIGKCLYQMEKHFAQKLKIFGKPCDCMPGDSLVYVSNPVDGQIIDNVKPFSEVYKRRSGYTLTHKATMKPITGHMSRSFSGELNEILFGYCNIPLKLTAEHSMFTLEDGAKLKRSRHIRETDLAWMPSRYFTLNDYIAFPRTPEHKDMEIITPSLAELIGWYIAEGCKGEENRIVISLGHHEKVHIDHVMSLFHSVFGEYPKTPTRETSFQMTYSHREFVPLFAAFGCDAISKRLPQWCLRLAEHKIGAMLRGLFSGDGSLSHYGLQYSTGSLQLACQLRLLLFNLGILHRLIRTGYCESNIKGRQIKSTKPRYIITVNGEAMERLVEITHLPWSMARKQRAYNHGLVTEEHVFLPARRVRQVPYEGKLYNMSVLDDESYLTPQGSVHNCGMKTIGLGLLGDLEETIPLVENPDVYYRVIDWVNTVLPKSTQEASASGLYENEYPFFSHQAREFRKEIMGTLDVTALFPPKPSQETGKAPGPDIMPVVTPEEKAKILQLAHDKIDKAINTEELPAQGGPPPS